MIATRQQFIKTRKKKKISFIKTYIYTHAQIIRTRNCFYLVHCKARFPLQSEQIAFVLPRPPFLYPFFFIFMGKFPRNTVWMRVYPLPITPLKNSTVRGKGRKIFCFNYCKSYYNAIILQKRLSFFFGNCKHLLYTYTFHSVFNFEKIDF